MGSAASSSPAVGVALNPRVEYASKLAQSEGKTHLIDVPVLVDLPQGTVRYRYVDKQHHLPSVDQSSLTLQGGDGPHRGNQHLENKKGYFFHARLADYSTEANKTNVEADYKFKYVYTGPHCAKNKRLYYVTGRGMHPSDSIGSYSSGLNSPVWPNIRKEHNHAYYSLEQLLDDTTSIDDSLDISVQINSTLPILMNANRTDTADALKEKVSLHILKPTTQIHVFHQQREIRSGVSIGGLFNDAAGKDQLKVKLSPL